jgi:hypothetical protein
LRVGGRLNGAAIRGRATIDSTTAAAVKSAATQNARACRRPGRRAGGGGGIRPDAGASDLFALITAAAWVREQVSDEQAERLLRIMLDGLRPHEG